MAMEYMNLQIAAHNISGEVYMERVAPGAGKATAPVNFISGENSAGLFPAEAIDCQGYGRIVIRSLFASGATGVHFLPIGYDAAGKILGPMTTSPDVVSIELLPTLVEAEGKFMGPVVAVSNEDIGASKFKVQLLSTSGEVFMDYSLV